jgi:hypothetical protein
LAPAVENLGLSTRQRAGGRLVLGVVAQTRRQIGNPPGAGLGHRNVLDLRSQPVDLDAKVLLEREFDRIIDRQAADDAGWLLGLALRQCRWLAECGQKKKRPGNVSNDVAH